MSLRRHPHRQFGLPVGGDDGGRKAWTRPPGPVVGMLAATAGNCGRSYMDEPVRIVEDDDGALEVSLFGDIDFGNSPSVRETIREAVDRTTPTAIPVDLGGGTLLASPRLPLPVVAPPPAPPRPGPGSPRAGSPPSPPPASPYSWWRPVSPPAPAPRTRSSTPARPFSSPSA